MSSKVISITSQSHFKSILASSTYIVVDFYADWCGPCKQISPIFEQLANQESKPGRLAFVKVNVDNQRDVTATYGVSAMPTFLVLKGTKVVETVRGANPNALRSAILSAAADAAKGPARQSAAFGGSGVKLGGDSSASGGRTLGSGAAGGGGGLQIPNVNFGQLFSAPASFAQGSGVLAQVVRFVGLYVSTLFSFDPVKTAEESAFAVKGRTNIKTR